MKVIGERTLRADPDVDRRMHHASSQSSLSISEMTLGLNFLICIRTLSYYV